MKQFLLISLFGLLSYSLADAQVRSATTGRVLNADLAPGKPKPAPAKSQPTPAKPRVARPAIEEAPSSRGSLAISVRGGMTQLYGDLNQPRANAMGGLDIMLPFAKILSAGLAVDGGKLRSEQFDFYNSRAETQFYQGALMVGIDVLRLFYKQPTTTSFRLYGGYGLIFLHAEAFDMTTNALQRFSNNQQSHHTPDGIKLNSDAGIYWTIERAIPLGMRFSQPIGQHVSLFGDVRFNFVRTTKLDATRAGDNSLFDGKGGGDIYKNPRPGEPRDKWAGIQVGITYHVRSLGLKKRY